MKRELKVSDEQHQYSNLSDCKAHPDEKGTESKGHPRFNYMSDE